MSSGTIEAKVTQDGNRVELHCGAHHVAFEIDGVDLPPVEDHSFALWFLLAYGLETGHDIHIHGVVDPVTLDSVRRACRTWAMWQPGRLHRINISADELRVPRPAALEGLLTFFSGGVDSTNMMLAKGRLQKPGTALTVHGMDYALERPGQFAEMLEATASLMEHLNYRRLVIRSDAKKIARGYYAYSMALAGHGWLLSNLFAGAEMAADYTLEQDMLAFPWASNGVTNHYYVGSQFNVAMRSEDTGRTEKVARIASDDVALRSVTFCKTKSLRPKNCGMCQKCLRTKASLLIATGEIPDIFIDRSFPEDGWSRFDLSSRTEVAFFLDMYESARDRGTVPRGLQAAYEKRFMQRPLSLASARDRIAAMLGSKRRVRAVDPRAG